MMENEKQIQKRIIDKPKIKCQEGNTIEMLCINCDCRFSALCCSVEACKVCIGSHANCLCAQLAILTKKVENRLKFGDSILKKLFMAQDQAMKKFQAGRIELKRQRKTWIKRSKCSELINKIYFNNSLQDVYGSDIKMLFNVLPIDELRQKCQRYVDLYSKQATRMLEGLAIYRQTIIQSILKEESMENIQKESRSFSTQQLKDNQEYKPRTFQIKDTNQQSKKKYKSMQINDSCIIQEGHVENLSKKDKQQKQDKMLDSQILLNDEQGKKMISYLMQELGNPSQLKLLFRASEHDFNSRRFHRICNNIRRTVTIVRTGFNKTIAGYTQYEWASRNYFLFEKQKLSFLLQLDLKEKFSLQKPIRSLYDHEGYGPSFGYDLVITHHCHKYISSYSNFPYSYNNEKNYEKNKQQNRELLCGVQEGNKFKVVEYEVFQVIQ